MDAILQLFDTSGFPPRWHCGSWNQAHGWLHILSDLGVWSAYVAIPCVLLHFVLRRRDIPFRRVFWLFGAFILACGTTHLMEAIIFWWPAYRLAGVIKLVTALVSWATVLALVPIVPKALAMRSPEDLEREVAARKTAEDALAAANAELERRVDQRTAELGAANDALRVSEERLRSALEELQRADQRKNEFMATLAHELRNPLAPIGNGIRILRGAGSEKERGRALEMMDRQLGQLVRLVDDLLDISRISRGKPELRRARVSLDAVIRDAVETAQPLIEAKGHRLTLSLPQEPLWLDADRTRLAQVFWNILTNSSKYTDPGGHIELRAAREGGEAVVRIRDDGIGFAPEAAPELFTLFSQLDRSLERSEGGLGIGLALAKGLVGLHGGAIEARSAGPGQGSEFVVRLPLEAEPAGGSDAGGAAPPSRAARPRRVLVADDNHDAAASLATALSMDGHEAITAEDGQHALELAEAVRPEVVFLDIGMPRVNGYECARRIRNEPWGRDVLLIAVTGWGQEDDKRRSREAGFDAHLVKPIDFSELGRLLAAAPR